MIVEQRTYDIIPGKVPAYLTLYREFGLDVQVEHLGCLVGYYHSEFGDLNQLVHLWRYADLNDRAARRARLFADPRWLAYLDKVVPLIVRQRSIILNPAPFAVPQPAQLAAAAD